MANKPEAEFDNYADEYERLLKDPLRDGFAGDAAFFHERKWILLREFLADRGLNPAQMDWLDVGCGKGEVLSMGAASFRSVVGCDPSPEMRKHAKVPTVQQTDPLQLPFEDRRFDLVTAICVYHHVPPDDRNRLTAEIRRVLRPGGLAAIIEHNPLNPATNLIVKRTPVDADAILLRAGETKALFERAGLEIVARHFFLYLPARIFRAAGSLERLGRAVPLGGQYVVWARVPR